MSASLPSMRALSAACLCLCLTACSTVSVPPTPPEPIHLTPPECLKLCPLMPEPTGPSEPETWRWQDEMISWGRDCAAIPDACAKALTDRM